MAPLLVALAKPGSTSRAFVLGLITGLTSFAGTLYWITHVMAVYGGLPMWVAVPVNAALVAYLALYPAIFAVVTARLVAAFGAAALMTTPFTWVATELGRTYLFTGFPWVVVGYSQATVLPVAQVASLVGVYGVSALVLGVNAALARIATVPSVALPRRPSSPFTARYAPLVVVAAIVGVAAAWGSQRVQRGELVQTGEPVEVGLVQGNIDQGIKWDPVQASAIFQSYLGMTEAAIARGATFVLWPESSTPFMFEEDTAGAEQVRAVARRARVPLLIGSDQVERGSIAKYFNSAFLVNPDGSVAGVYRKLHLVPFGEYVPQAFFFASRLVQAVSDFTPGDRSILLPVRGHFVSTAICYEIVYPDLVRDAVAAGSELLTTITNDAWFGQTSAPYQHFAQASMRAVESGRYLVRAANTGISGIVDPYGRVLAESRIFEPAVVVGSARFVRVRTVYTRIGDVFAYASVVLTAALLILAMRRVK